MVNKARDTIHRHRPSSLTLDEQVGKHLIRLSRSNSKYAVNIGLILTNPRIRQLRELGILVSKMPDIQRGRSLRTHLTSHARRLVAVVSPGFLITEDLIIRRIALGINLLIEDGLLTDIGENGEIVVQAVLTRPETFKTLLIGMVIAGDHDTDHKAVLNERLDKVTMNVSSNRKSGSIAERSARRLSSRGLHNLIDINRNTVAAKILRTLEASIGRSNAKMRLKNFNIPSTSSCVLLIKLLNLESHAELIDSSSGNGAIINRPKVRRSDRHKIKVGRRSGLSSLKAILRRRTRTSHADIRAELFGIVSLLHHTQSFSAGGRHQGIKSNDRKIGTLRNRNGYVGALLRSRKGAGKVVMELGRLKRHAAFDNIGDIVSAVGTCKGSVIHGNVKRIRKIFITKPLVHNECIGPERQRINGKISNTGRDTHVIGNRTNRPTAGRGSHLGNRILGLRNPSGLCILTHQLAPMLPDDTVRHEVKIGIQIKIVHHGSKQSLEAGHHRSLQLKSITGKNLVHIEGDNVSDVETEFNTMVTPKSATSNIKVSRIKSKSCIFITRQVNTSSL
nr:MAG TPA: hypothetical protein [Microviridae sp.]